MKRFVVDFEGEEEMEPTESDPWSRGLPDFLIFHSTLEVAVRDGNRIHGAGVPAWLVKYRHSPELIATGTSRDTYFAVGVERGPFVDLDEDQIDRLMTERPGKHFHIELRIPAVSNEYMTVELIQNADIIEIKPWGSW